jgi:hypothetical protein
VHPAIFLNRIEICVRMGGRLLAKCVKTIEYMINAFIHIYTTHATSLDQLPPGNKPLISISIADSFNSGWEAEELYDLAWKMAVCGKPSNYFNPALDDRPAEDYERGR